MVFITLIFFYLFLIKSPVSAQVIISEFSPTSETEWVEIYNTSENQVDLSSWTIKDNNSQDSDDLILTGCILPGNYRQFLSPGSWLNNSGGDSVVLKNSLNQIIDSVIYGEGGVIGTPTSTQSAAKDLINQTWSISNSPSPQNEPCSLPTPTPTQTPTPTLTPSIIPTPTSIPPTSTVTPTSTKTPTPTKKPSPTPTTSTTPSPTPTIENTPTPEAVLGTSDSITPIPTPTPTTIKPKESFEISKIIPSIFIILGGILLLAPLIINKLKRE